MTSTLCLVPFSSLHLAPDGSLRLCSSNLNKMFSNEEITTLDEMWSHERFQTLRQEMLDNKKPQACDSACYAQEARGLYSKREKYNSAKDSDYKNKDIDLDVVSPRLRYLDIAFSNVCNLKCVMCTSHYSTSWRADDARALEQGITFRRQVSPARKVGAPLVNEFLQLTPQLYGVWIKGGEPFADEQCLKYLSQLSARADWNDKFHVFVQSNGTLWTENIQDSIRGLPIHIGISVDGTEGIYEWVRGYSFKKLTENILAISQNAHVQSTMIDFTLSAYNVFNVVDTVNYFYQLKKKSPKLKSFHFTGIVRQEWGNVFSIPLDVRWKVSQELREMAKNWGDDVVGLESVLKVLERHDPQHAYFRETCSRWMTFCDGMRGRKLTDVDSRYQTIFTEPTLSRDL